MSENNLEKNDVVIIILDRPRQLWCGHKAIKTMSAMLGKSFQEIDTSNFNPADIEVIMFALLLKDAKEKGEILALEQMEDLLDIVPYGEIVEKMSSAFEKAFGEEQVKNAQRIATTGKSHGAGKKA